MKSALTENGIGYKDMHVDIGIMQKQSWRQEADGLYCYTGAYCGYFTCIIKSKDLITWEYVATPDFVNESQYENATYVIGDTVYYCVRQKKNQEGENYAFLTSYNLVSKTWSQPILLKDCQSRSDFLLYNNNLYLIHAPSDRYGFGIVRIDQNNLANSKVMFESKNIGSVEYPFIQYAYGADGEYDTSMVYLSYTLNRLKMRLTKFNPATYLK